MSRESAHSKPMTRFLQAANNQRFFKCLVLICLVRFGCWLALYGQWGHWNGRTPVCVRMCRFRSPAHPKTFPHRVHSWLRVPLGWGGDRARGGQGLPVTTSPRLFTRMPGSSPSSPCNTQTYSQYFTLFTSTINQTAPPQLLNRTILYIYIYINSLNMSLTTTITTFVLLFLHLVLLFRWH